MNRKELNSMIREIAREEVYRVLPDLLKEAVSETLTEIVAPKRKAVRQAPPRKLKQNGKQPLNRRSILEEIGYTEYGLAEDNMETYTFDSRDRSNIAEYAGVPVPMTGGLRSYENSMGQGGYQSIEGMELESDSPSAMDYQESPVGEVPAFLADAIGRAKDVVDKAGQMGGNFRPGQR